MFAQPKHCELYASVRDKCREVEQRCCWAEALHKSLGAPSTDSFLPDIVYITSSDSLVARGVLK